MDMKTFNSSWRSISKVKFPETGLVYDYYYDLEESKWTTWHHAIKAFEPSDESIFSKIYVNTIHTTRLRYLLNQHLNRRKPVLFIGSAGTGKSAVIKEYLANVDAQKVAYKTINFSSFTDSEALQAQIESMVQKKFGKIYGSGAGKTIICFIDDLNMPYVDKYGTQSPI